MVLVRHVSVEHHDLAGLNLAHAGDQGEQGGLADAVGPDQSRHALGRNIEGQVVERERLSVAVRYAARSWRQMVIWSLRKLHLKLVGPGDLGIGANEGRGRARPFSQD